MHTQTNSTPIIIAIVHSTPIIIITVYCVVDTEKPLKYSHLGTKGSWSDLRGGRNRQVHSNTRMTIGIKQNGQIRQCGRLIEART